MPAIPSELEAALTEAVRARFGAFAAIDNVAQATLGGSSRTILFDLVEGGRTRRLVSREETFSMEVNPFLSPADQFVILRHVFAHGVPVPEPMFEYGPGDALGPGFVSAFVAGETLPRRLVADRGSHPRILAETAAAVAMLHALPIEDMAFLEAVPESGDPLAALRQRIDALDEPHPALELGLRWLELNRPPSRPRVHVHGDLRNGNLMVADGGLAALLDWECSHLGSPAEDLGWLCTRSWRFGAEERHAGGFGTRSELIEAYMNAGGAAIEPDEVRWWERFGLARWAMYNMLQGFGFDHGRRSPAFAACGRNTAIIEYDLLMTIAGKYD